MDVILIRHADAGDRNPAAYPDDDRRGVTAGGERKMGAAVRAMKAMGIRFDHLLTSPLTRAIQTAAIVRDTYELNEPAQVSDTLGHGCSPTGVVQLLSRFGPADTIALVGHEPALSDVAAAMISPSGDVRIALRKGGCIGIGFDGTARLGTGTLQFLLKAGQLKQVGL